MRRRSYLAVAATTGSLLAGCTDAGDDVEELDDELDEESIEDTDEEGTDDESDE